MLVLHRKIYIILLLVSFCNVIFASSKARLFVKNFIPNSQGQVIAYQFFLPSFDVMSAKDGFKKLYVKGLYPLSEPGKPELYTIGSLVALPEGFEIEAKITDKETEKITDVLIMPYQLKTRCGTQNWVFNFDSATYKNDNLYPNNLIELKEVGRIQSFRIVRIGINPLRVNSVKKILEVTRNLSFEIFLIRTKWASNDVKISKSVYDFVRKITVNGQVVGTWSKMTFEAEKLLVVTADDYENALKPFVEWKRQKGLIVKLVTLSEAGGTKEKVKEYVQNYYDKEKFTYLLFVGNKNSMPAYFESTESGSAISDYRMALLSGSDVIPDVFYGRLLADNESEVITQIERWINYEKSPVKGEWFYKGITIASSEGYDPSDKEYAQMVEAALKSYTYKEVNAFLQGEGTATTSNISNAINSGSSWISYFGHGSGTSWASTNDEFDNSAVDKLNNQGKLPILIDVACSNASWAYYPRCFGKAWVTNTSNAGAIAFYGGSVSISWDPPAIMSVGISKYHFEKPVHSLGGSVLAGQMYLVEKMGTGNQVIDNMKWYNLFGDPSLIIRTDTPKEYSLTTLVKPAINAITLEVSAVDLNGEPLSGLLISLMTPDGNILGVGKTDSSGKVSMFLQVSSLNGMILTSSGYNMETQEVTLR